MKSKFQDQNLRVTDLIPMRQFRPKEVKFSYLTSNRASGCLAVYDLSNNRNEGLQTGMFFPEHKL